MDPWSGFGFAQKNEKSVFGFGNPDLGFPKKCTLGWVRLGNLDLDFEIWISDFAIEREIRKRIAPPRNPSSEWIEIRNPNPDFLDFHFTVRLEIRKKDLQNSGLLFANYTCVCKTTVVIRTVFQILYWISNRTVKMKIQKQISQRWNQFQISRSIANTKSRF